MMTERSFSEALAAMAEKDGAYHTPLPENWMQGRTAFGGYTAAVMLAAAMKTAPGAAGLRSALINFTGPITGDMAIRTELLRAGRNVTTIAARAEVEGGVAAAATFSFGAPRESVVAVDHPAPPCPAPEDLDDYFPPEAARMIPRFALQFDGRMIAGARPFSGAEEGSIEAWVRHKDPAAREGQVGLLAVADMLPPAVYAMLKGPAINSSMTWICNILTDDFTAEDGWWRLSNHQTAARDGYSSQVMRIWDRQGRLVVDGMQSVALFT